MKKIISIITVIAVAMSQFIFVSAGDLTSKQDSVFSMKTVSVKYNENQCRINVITPYLNGFEGADVLNQSIRNKVCDNVGQAKSTATSMKEIDEEISQKDGRTIVHTITLDTTYDYSKSGDILSLQLNTLYYSGGAHPTNWIDSYTVNTSTGEIYTLKGLFKENSDYANFLTNSIISYIDKSPEYYFKEYAKTISDKKGDFKFYIDGNNLVIYFGLYDIAPYAAGIKRFVFRADDLKDILKDEVYNSIKDAKPIGTMRFNGSDSGIDMTCLTSPKGLMVPLRAVASSLGYIVGWNENEGATVAGGAIKEGADSYWTYGKEPVSLGEPVVQDGITYVPLRYFRDVLEENVSLGSINYIYVADNGGEPTNNFIIRIFDRNTSEDNFSRLISKLEFQQNDLDCVNAYAEAVKNRNGAVQYGLLTDKYRAESYKDFCDRYFVTGVSSPWVDNYDIVKTGDNLYEITFHMTTSARDKMDYVSIVSLEKAREEWRISSVKNK